MRLFFEFVKISFQRQFAYRTAVLASLLTNFFFGIVRMAVMIALYGTRQEVAGITLQGAITFTGLTQSAIGFLSLFGWYEMMNSIYTGGVGSDLLKPMGYFRFWMAQDLGRMLAHLIMRGLTMMIVYAVLFHITSPQSVTQWIAFSLSLILAWLVGFCYRFLVNLAGFWTPNALGIGRFGFILVYFFSGFLMPLRYFPDWFSQLVRFTPFPYIVNTTVEVYLGVLEGSELWMALGLQAIWAVVMLFICQVVLRAGFRRLVILGG